MKRRYFQAWAGLFLGIQGLFMSSLAGQEKEAIPPLRNVPLLSGSFGELRATHFHSGIDLKTGGQTGLPVLCVKEGVLARVRVSPAGYGNALYLEHPDGTTTVYGHLDRFQEKIARMVRELQYSREIFVLDEDMKHRGLYFRQGDIIAYSGNTGSSGGPHLHFEYRDTGSECLLNPLLYLSVKDEIAPRIRKLYIYRITPAGRVQREREIALKSLGNNRYTGGTITLPPGTFGVGIYVTDAMNDSWNKLGIYRLQMECEGKERFFLKVDSCVFDKNNLIDDLKDFGLYQKKNETVYRCFGNYVAALPGVRCADKGEIRVGPQQTVPVGIEVADINGNNARLSFQLCGGRTSPLQREENILSYQKSHRIQSGPYSLILEEGALFASVDSVVRRDTLPGEAGHLYPVFVCADRETPLVKKSLLKIRGPFRQECVICRIRPGEKPEALITFRENGHLCTYINVLGNYTVLTDTLAPRIEYLGMVNGKLKFRVKDELSGLDTWRGEVEGKWTLFGYDAKTSMIECDTQEPVFEKGKSHTVCLKVRDKAGNEAGKSVKVRIN